MSRNQSGGFNKFLNFIGLVDDDRPQDSRVDEYGSGSYGRPATYVPARQRSDSRAASNTRRSIPAQAGRSNYGSARRYDEDESRYSSTRRSARFEDDKPEAPRAPRMRSRFEESDEPEEFTAPAPRPARPSAGNGRTVMISLENLKDANMVITALVKGNTIVMTLNTEDEHLKERIIDTLSGAVFALDATIRKASFQTYLLAPKSVNVKAAYEVDDQF